MLLLLIAIWCWGMAFTTLVGPTVRVIFGVIGVAAFIWYKTMKPKAPNSNSN